MESDSKTLGVIVVPCYNEEARINQEYFQILIHELNKLRFRLLFVNDGSSDSTGRIIEEFVQQGALTLHLAKNLGKAEAIRKGLIESKNLNPNCTVYGYLDADAAFGVADVIEIASTVNLKDRSTLSLFLSGARISMAGSVIKRNKLRHVIGRAIVTILNLEKNIAMYDPQSGLKIFRVDRFNQLLLEQPFKTKWFVDLEILTRLSLNSLEVLEYPVKQWIEMGGSKLGVRDALRIGREVMIIKKIIRDSRKQISLLEVRNAINPR
jgi:dolichyl-phosphate beta-glucosyltransferase